MITSNFLTMFLLLATVMHIGGIVPEKTGFWEGMVLLIAISMFVVFVSSTLQKLDRIKRINNSAEGGVKE